MPRHHKHNCIKSSLGKATINQITQGEIFKVGKMFKMTLK